jgi:hypothetical protein
MTERESLVFALFLNVAELREGQVTFTVRLVDSHTPTNALSPYQSATMGARSSHVKRPDFIFVGI